MTTKRQRVYDAINDERNHQDLKWGDIDEHPHEVGAWVCILAATVDKARSAWLHTGDQSALAEIRQVAAVAVACMEQHGPVFRG